jgi:Cu-processing system permease protein
MGYTGAFYKKLFGSPLGILFTTLAQGLWIVIPLVLSVRIFNRKDL